LTNKKRQVCRLAFEREEGQAQPVHFSYYIFLFFFLGVLFGYDPALCIHLAEFG
jgi:hypothetical protein